MTPQEANPIQTFRKPLSKRFFFALLRRSWVVVPIALALWVLTGCSADMRYEYDVAREMEAIHQDEAAKASRAFVGREKCGPAAVHQWDGDVLSCFPKRGKSYQVARSAP